MTEKRATLDESTPKAQVQSTEENERQTTEVAAQNRSALLKERRAREAEENRAVDDAFEPEITLTPTGVLIKNNSQKTWETCWVYINFHFLWSSGYRHLSFDFAPHESHEIAYSEFWQHSDSGTKIFSESGEQIKRIRFTASVGKVHKEYETSVRN